MISPVSSKVVIVVVNQQPRQRFRRLLGDAHEFEFEFDDQIHRIPGPATSTSFATNFTYL